MTYDRSSKSKWRDPKNPIARIGTIIFLILAVLFLLTFFIPPQEAKAHPGGSWYLTPREAADNIRAKYDVDDALCGKIDRSFVHYMRFGFVTRYDHILCAIRSNATGRECATLLHVTGPKWWNIVLTSWPKIGCSPADIRRL